MTDARYAACTPLDSDQEYLKLAKRFVMYFYSVQDAIDRKEENANNPQVQKMNQMALEAYQRVYQDKAAKTFEGCELYGKPSICDHLDKKLTFKTIRYCVTTVDAQPGPPPHIIVMVTGQLQTDEDRPLPFSHSFLLHYNEALGADGTKQQELTIQNELFRLGVHNFASA